MWLFLKNPTQGCQSIVYLAVEPSLSNISGYYFRWKSHKLIKHSWIGWFTLFFSDCEIKEPADLVKDGSLAQALYDKTCQMVKIVGRKVIEELKTNGHVVKESGDNEDSF